MLINKDLTREKIWMNVSGGEIYAEVYSKVHGRWITENYFQKYDFEIDRELTKLTIKEIKRLWKLNNPKVFLAFGN